MRSTELDVTARARIRDAGIACIARHGFAGTTIRQVATEAGVSPGLVLHHFGSKEGLRTACDDHVWTTFHEALRDSTGGTTMSQLLDQWARRPTLIRLSAYLVRSLIDGGDFARRFFAGMVQDVRRYMAAAVESGMVRPSKDEATRALMLTSFSLGSLVLGRYIVGDDVDPLEVPQRVNDMFTAEGLDIYTDGLFTDSTVRDAFLADQAGAGAYPAPAEAPED
jgi:AcrR family transcriptional regulator